VEALDEMGVQFPNRAGEGVLDEGNVLVLDEKKAGVLLVLHWGS